MSGQEIKLQRHKSRSQEKMNVISENEKSQSEALGVNPLGTEPVGKLLRQFAVPSIVAMLVSALYNLVDQFFIGQSIGELGNAATNVALE